MKKVLEVLKEEIKIKEKLLEELRDLFDKMDANNATNQGQVSIAITIAAAELKALEDFLNKLGGLCDS